MARILRGDGVNFPSRNRIVASSTLDVYDDCGFIIGFVTGFNETQARPVVKIRHLSSRDAARIIEVCPNVETISLSVTGYSLYDISLVEKGSLIHRLGSAMRALKSLQSQTEPFNMARTETHPSSGEIVRDIYFDCWITNFTRNRAIGTLVQTDSATIEVGQKE
jgi:hypothetical protein